jgi:PAS domain S-box-containing protein
MRKKQRLTRSALLAGAVSLHLLLPGQGFALDPVRDVLQYNCQTWDRQNGLPANGINAITQTKDGYLWLGTTVGLVRFDGIEFKLLDLARVPQVRNSIVTTLANGKDGGLWVGLENNAFGFYDGQSFSFRGRDVFGGVNMNVRTILESKDGTLWLAAERMAARLTRSGSFEEVLGSSTNYLFNVTCGYEDSQGRLWFGTADSGVYYWQAGKITKLPGPALEASRVDCVAEDLKGQIWIGTTTGLFRYDSNLVRKEIPPLPGEIRALLVDRHGVLWIGTSGQGLVRYQDGKYSFLRKTDGLTSDYVKSLAEDREGSLWIGTRDGLSQLTDVKFPTHQAAEDPTVKDALAVGASRKGGVWVGSSAGLTYFDGQPKTYGVEAGLTNLFIKRVFEAGNGDVYLVSGTSTLVVFSGEKAVASYSATNMLVGLAEDAHGVVASVGGYLYRVGTNYFTPYPFTNVQPTLAWVLNLASGRDGEIWVACGAGIFRVKDGAFQQWAADAPAWTIVQWVCEDSDGVVWGAQLTGIVRLKDNQLRYINRTNGLFDNNIYSIVPDDFGNLWVDSSRGIFRVSRKSMNDFADGKTAQVRCVAYDGPESVKPADKTTQEHVGCKTSDGRIWFPSANGLVEVDPAHIPTNQIPPPVHIDLVRANGIELVRDISTIVPPGQGELEFHFTALSFLAPQKVRFRYRLEGYDKDWVEAKDRRLAFYTNLKPGRYTFRVIAANADGVWNEEGDTLPIELRPHYYQTGWFDLLCGGLGLAALIGVYLQRVRRLKLKQQELQKNRDLLEVKVRERTAELAKANQALLAEIGERKRAEEALATEQRLLNNLFTATPDIIYFKDRECRFLRINQGFTRRLGLSDPSEALGKTDFDFFGGQHAPEAYADEQQIMATGQPMIDKEEREDWKDGRVTWVSSTKLPTRDGAGKIIGIMGISRDITERKQFEARLFQSQKMETVGKLAGGVAHEFNSIMTAIIGQSELMLHDLPPGHPLRRNASEIHQAADRAAALTRQLLAYGRKQILQPDILDLNGVLAGLENTLRHLAGPNVDVRIAPPAGPKLVKVDAGQIEQVIVNVVMNAADAMPRGGKLTLETDEVVLDEEYVSQFADLKAGEYVRLAITDTGAGMCEAVKARIFEPFFTTKEVGKGTGLGLATCHGIIKQSEGHISVYSEPGRGATFKIYLPKARLETKAPGPPLKAPGLPRGTETILLVEDDPALREMAATLLGRLGYTVLTAADGLDALNVTHQRATGHIDLLFTDVVMPHMSGKELSDRIRALYPRTKILFTSAYTENAIVHQGILNAGVTLLQKPFTPSALANKVREVLDGGTGGGERSSP